MKKIIIAFGLFCLSCFTAHALEFEAGKHYEVIPKAVATHNKEKIEVTEVFWYGCIHCFRFEPMVKEWRQSLAEDVEFIGVPAMWNQRLRIHAQAFYTAKRLGISKEVHQPLFDALHEDSHALSSEAEIALFFAKYGVANEAFHKAFNSSAVQDQLKHAAEKSHAYGVQGTPELIINGKYRISTRTAGGQSEMLAVADYLIDKERQAKTPPPAPANTQILSSNSPENYH